MSDSLYKGIILEHSKEPHNFGELEDADVEVDADIPSCGDEFTFYATFDEGKIADITFSGSGCALSTASSSRVTDEVQGEDVSTVKNISDERIFELVGLEKRDVSPMRVKCVLLVQDALDQLLEEAGYE